MTDVRPTDQEFLEFAVKALVDNPGDVKVERKIDEMGVLITLDVNPADMGMVIGREGQTAKALRTILRVIGARNNARVNLKINEPEGSTRGERTPRPEAAPAPEAKKSIDDVLGDMNI
ncbi:MAG: KH domain-containing protein [Candidatus Moranbacteria bacterium]|nr:KH domain-containing protein [Candidatus Moranbacteria bacterium]